MTLDPLGYDPIKDVDEIYSRHRRKTDDPYIKATMKGTHGTTSRTTGETDKRGTPKTSHKGQGERQGTSLAESN